MVRPCTGIRTRIAFERASKVAPRGCNRQKEPQMPSTGSVNGSARGPQGKPPQQTVHGTSGRNLDALRHERAMTRLRVIESLLMCPGSQSGARRNGVVNL
jgi:hypothetical protein